MYVMYFLYLICNKSNCCMFVMISYSVVQSPVIWNNDANTKLYVTIKFIKRLSFINCDSSVIEIKLLFGQIA